MKLFVLLLLSLAAAHIFATPEDDLRNGNLAFSKKLYKAIAATVPNENFVFSPFPVQTIMAALASAAYSTDEPAAVEIRNAVGLLQSNALTEQAFKSILHKLTQTDDDFKLFDAFKMYFNTNYQVEEWYKKLAQKVYGTEVETVNFKQAGAVQNINSWVARKTDHNINNIVTTNDVNDRTQNLLVNALYLRGKWDKPFEKNYARRSFYGQKKTSTVDMMISNQTYEYFENDEAKHLKLELVREEQDAYVEFILPHFKNGLARLENNIGNVFSTKTYPVSKVHVTLPRFSIDSDVKLKPILQNLGVNKLFNFGIKLLGLRYLHHPYSEITNVFQKSSIEITRWGISASTATAAIAFVDDPEDVHEFTADHPFLFQIVVDDIVVFAGRVVDL